MEEDSIINEKEENDNLQLVENQNVDEYEDIEKTYKNKREMLEKINNLGIGPQGFGGNTTALAVNIETFPTHIAGLPVVVNINCHCARHKQVII